MFKTLTRMAVVLGLLGTPANSQCILDLDGPELVQKWQELPKPESQVILTGIQFRLAVLLEAITPGTAAEVLDVAPLFAKEGETLGYLEPIAQQVLDGDYRQAALQIKSTGNTTKLRNASGILTELAILSGDYDILQENFPFGDDTYTRNLNMGSATRTALQAGRVNLAIDIYQAHDFGNHTATTYTGMMTTLLSQGKPDAARRLTQIIRAQADAYVSEGGLTLCLERQSKDQCIEDAQNAPDLGRLELFDAAAFDNCYILMGRDKRALALCLADIRMRADAAGYHPKPHELVGDALSGAAYVAAWGFEAVMGNPKPDDVPNAVFRETGRNLTGLHAKMLAALTYFGTWEEYNTYEQRVLDITQPDNILDQMTSPLGQSLSEQIDTSLLHIAYLQGDYTLLAELQDDPDMPDWIGNTARYYLFQMALENPQGGEISKWAQKAKITPERLLTLAQNRQARGDTAASKILFDVSRQAICRDQVVLDDRQTRTVLMRQLMERAVQAGKFPDTVMLH